VVVVGAIEGAAGATHSRACLSAGSSAPQPVSTCIISRLAANLVALDVIWKPSPTKMLAPFLKGGLSRTKKA